MLNKQSGTTLPFKTFTGDPLAVQHTTLPNGLQLFLSVNHTEPRVYTEIAVRAGSKHDPADTTGLAHYFEHMMFKGTDRLGSLDWEKEKILLDQIEQKFEQHRAEQDPAEKKKLYAEIDALSFEAAKLAAANEYDKLVSAIGAKNTNAYTWLEQTVYVNDVPANELERWFALEAERFRRPVLRLFHTELETVFEEYNISQDKDFRKTSRAMQEVLTPTHPYGTQTTLGRGEDLKNPSQTNIYRFFDQYYVPNNMAIVLSGDFDPQQAVELAQRYFGKFEAKPLPKFRFERQPELAARTIREVWGNEASWVELGWRFDGAASAEAVLLPLVSGILYNQQAGLFDLNLLQKQQVLEAYAYPRIHEDYCGLTIFGKPREGQTLEEVEKLLLGEVQKLASGDFEDWLPQAVVKDMKLSEIKEFEKNTGRANALTGAYILGLDWDSFLKRWKKLEKTGKQEAVDFAQKHLRTDNYCVVFKRHGEDKSVMKVEKPEITAIEVNRVAMSDFAQQFLQADTPEIEPQFLDFQKLISKKRLSDGLNLHHIHDPKSQLFRLFFTFDMGKNADPKMALAATYLSFLGTSRLSAAQVQQEFYKLGVHFSAECQEERMYFTLMGLPESLEAGVALVYELFADAQPDAAALENLIADTLQKRVNAKMDKNTILRHAMVNFAKFGSRNPYNSKLSEAELRAITPAELVEVLRRLQNFRHNIFYHGSKSAAAVAKILKKQLPQISTVRQKPVATRKFVEQATRRDQVFFVHFPTVQVELMLISKGSPKFSLEEFSMSEWYNQYFGYGLSSIVFQEIRESKALAYAAYTFFSNPSKKSRAHFLSAYVGTQPDKLHTAVEAFQTILEEMPVSAQQIENARQSVLKQIAAERITRDQIYWQWRTTIERGFRTDLRQATFEKLRQAAEADLLDFQRTKIKGRMFNWLVLGDRERVDFQYLKKIGRVRELNLEEIFGY